MRSPLRFERRLAQPKWLSIAVPVLALLAALAGVLVLLLAGEGRAEPGAQRRFGAGLLIGWGGFNLVEGLVDHHLLGLHHVRPGPDQLAYDLGFLAWGLLMLVAGWTLLRRTDPTTVHGGTTDG